MFQHGIYFHKYHGKTLTGDHCATFINKIDEITFDVNAVLSSIIEGRFNDQARLDKVKERLNTMIRHVSILSYVFREICHCLYLTEPLSTEELDSFDKLCSLFGELWRNFGINVSPKVHIIESHLNDYCRLGILTDDTTVWKKLGPPVIYGAEFTLVSSIGKG